MPQTPRLSIDSPNGTLVAVVSTVDRESHGIRLLVQSVNIVRKEEMGVGSASEAKGWPGFGGYSVAAIHSCENDDIDIKWTSETALVIRYSQTKPDWVSFVKTAKGVSISLEEVPRTPNQPPLPTPTDVTPAAGAFAPPSRAGDR
jgi:hypothetical protein